MVEFDSPPSPPGSNLTPRLNSRGVFVPKSLDGETGVCNESNSPSSLVSKLNTLDYGRSGQNGDGIPFLERLALLTVDKPIPPTYYFPMATERLRKRIEHLLDEAEEAI